MVKSCSTNSSENQKSYFQVFEVVHVPIHAVVLGQAKT